MSPLTPLFKFFSKLIRASQRHATVTRIPFKQLESGERPRQQSVITTAASPPRQNLFSFPSVFNFHWESRSVCFKVWNPCASTRVTGQFLVLASQKPEYSIQAAGEEHHHLHPGLFFARLYLTFDSHRVTMRHKVIV